MVPKPSSSSPSSSASSSSSSSSSSPAPVRRLSNKATKSWVPFSKPSCQPGWMIGKWQTLENARKTFGKKRGEKLTFSKQGGFARLLQLFLTEVSTGKVEDYLHLQTPKRTIPYSTATPSKQYPAHHLRGEKPIRKLSQDFLRMLAGCG